MASLNQNFCGHNGCRNPVKSPGDLCWRHKDAAGATGLSDAGGLRAQPNAETTQAAVEAHKSGIYDVQAPRTVNPIQYSALLYSGEGLLDAEDALKVSLAADKYFEQGAGDYSVPQFVATQAKREGDMTAPFREALEAEGISRDRMTVITMHGLTRFGASGTSRSNPNVTYEAIILDEGTEGERVIDPNIAMLAPVRDRKESVDDQLEAGKTPFGDRPWVGTLDQFVDSGLLKWDEVEFRDC